jgi:hypothetical protein
MKHDYFSFQNFREKRLAKRQTGINREGKSFYVQKVKNCLDFSDTEKKTIIENYNRLKFN